MSLPVELAAFTGRLLAVRESDKALTSDVARAITPETERYAYAYTVPATTELHRREMAIGATRALGMVAKYRRSPNSTSTLGACFARIPGVSEGIAERLALLVDLEVEQAAQVIEGLVSRADDARVGINFYSLVETLAFWDTGDPDRDLAHRSRLLYDFHTRPSAPTKKAV
jgi:hypothetical protein